MMVAHTLSWRFSFRSRLQRDRERDISEKIALGMPSAGGSNDLQFDQRLFNQSRVGTFTSCYMCTFMTYVLVFINMIN